MVIFLSINKHSLSILMPQSLKATRLNFIDVKSLNSSNFIKYLQYGTVLLTLLSQIIITACKPSFFDNKLVYIPFYIINILLTIIILYNNLNNVYNQDKTDTNKFILFGGLGLILLISIVLSVIFPNNIAFLPLLAYLGTDLINSIILGSGCLSSLLITGFLTILIFLTFYCNYNNYNVDILGCIATVGIILYTLQSLLVDKKKSKQSATNIGTIILTSIVIITSLALFFSNDVLHFSALPQQLV
ncbi:hypothetical protein M153_2108000826 [Pseudoloma neurophilia]|uniref:Uncharacterized protein n=1 Tax=Pseudoloma neurophilia TaxID=146866 RepID=A0A0R0M0E0_9MICR|nr:hypothetical protein M153_2108000826 [Pseudoloma neurophilia]